MVKRSKLEPYVKDGRVIGQWAQPDLWGIYRQLTRPEEPAD
jgi:hypothetical protein